MTDTVTELLLVSSVIALGFLFAVAFYESLCKRDVLVARTMRVARRLSPRRWVAVTAYLLSVGLGIPFLVLLWAGVLELTLLVVGSVDRLGNVAFVATAVVAAARILAYVREKTSHELAKAIPLAVGFLLLTGGATKLEPNLASVAADPNRSNLTDEMIVFMVGLELALRLAADSSHALLAAIRRRRGIADEAGVWRTLWAAVGHRSTAR